jgi:steroid delta-isomerase-like uncharacterized protein
MSTDENKALYRRFIEEVINRHDLDRLEAFLTPDIIEHTPGMPSGVAGARQFTAAYFTAFPDLQLSIDDLIAEGDRGVARLTATGTHRGVFLGILLTGKRVTIASLDAWRVQDGKCAEHWSQVDMLGLLQQLGVTAVPEQAG